ncbi:hypothetical protein PIB30_010285 [Stylosanthes scabra]|uniref:Uncharacterized protein n=1 Tax=Stylosanthes scabra TaxID=79078 RepID=A0ABU6T7M1_9FABA|nr:hypothetical protein [Stylosanthes scabra]
MGADALVSTPRREDLVDPFVPLALRRSHWRQLRDYRQMSVTHIRRELDQMGPNMVRFVGNNSFGNHTKTFIFPLIWKSNNWYVTPWVHFCASSALCGTPPIELDASLDIGNLFPANQRTSEKITVLKRHDHKIRIVEQNTRSG